MEVKGLKRGNYLLQVFEFILAYGSPIHIFMGLIDSSHGCVNPISLHRDIHLKTDTFLLTSQE